MKKLELVERLASDMQSTKAQAENVLNLVVSTIANTLTAGESVTLTGFGSFDVLQQASRTGRNPQTGASITIPARKKVRFKASKTLKDKVNS